MAIVRSHMTRVLHLAVLLTVVDQLLTSLIMERPLPGEDPDWPFALHRRSAWSASACLMLFWLWTLIRDERETPLQQLFPWFSERGIRRVVADIGAIVRAEFGSGRRRCISTRCRAQCMAWGCSWSPSWR